MAKKFKPPTSGRFKPPGDCTGRTAAALLTGQTATSDRSVTEARMPHQQNRIAPTAIRAELIADAPGRGITPRGQLYRFGDVYIAVEENGGDSYFRELFPFAVRTKGGLAISIAERSEAEIWSENREVTL